MHKNNFTEEKQAVETSISKLEQVLCDTRKKNFKNFGIRNLKIFGNMCNFLIPFAVTAGLVTSGIYIAGGGLPFKKDQITKYKTFRLESYQDGSLEIRESYEETYWYQDLKNSDLTLIYPWVKEENGLYKRVRREYDLSQISLEKLYEAVLNKNISYIEQNLKCYREETEVRSSVENSSNDYIIEASLYTIDKEIKLYFPETDVKNNLVSILTLCLTLMIGSIVAFSREFHLLKEIRFNIEDYPIIYTRTLKKNIKDEKEKLEVLLKKERNL